MKTLRELLLARHRAAEKKLDAMREEFLAERASAGAQTARPRERGWMVALSASGQELLRPLRLHLAGLAAVWLVIAAMKLATPGAPAATMARSTPPSAEQRMALAEKRRLLAELTDPPALRRVEVPKPFSPRPRSERRVNVIAV